jgi:hypothetical protein
MSNIKAFGIGEPFDEYVNSQIRVRQEKKAAGFGDKSRTPEELSYLISQNSWVRCASPTSITDIGRLTGENSIGFTEDEAKGLMGQALAKRYVLFNGTSQDNQYNNPFGGYNTTGANTSNTAYGLGGLDFGQVPMPGITTFRVSHINNGSLREANLIIEANNRVQFNILEALYVRLGFTIFIEWGNNLYFDNGGNFVSKPTPSLIEDDTWFDKKTSPDSLNTFLDFAEKIEERREQNSGNYDAFLGRVTNYDVQFTSEGKYQITLSIISTGDVVESIGVNNLTYKNFIVNNNNQDLKSPAEENKCDLENFLQAVRNDKDPETSQVNRQNSEGKTDFVDLSTQANLEKKIEITDLFYIRFGALLKFIEKNISPHVDNKPILPIDEASDKHFRLFKTLVSTDPSKCVIKNENVLESFDKEHNSIFDPFDSAVNPENKTQGIIGNIYLNVRMLEDLFHNMIGNDRSKTVTLFNYLDKICDTINSCFGGYTNIQTTVFREGTVIMRDLNIIEPRPTDDNQEIIKVYGYTPAESDTTIEKTNILRGFDFRTEISSDLATTIAIGASVNKTDSYISNFFDALNFGLVDIYQQGDVTDGESQRTGEAVNKNLDEATSTKDKKLTTPAENQVTEGTDSVPETTKADREENKKIALDKKEEAKKAYFTYLSNMFSIPQIGGQHIYFLLRKDNSDKGSSSLSRYVTAMYDFIHKDAQSKNKPGGQTKNNFIPIRLNLSLDGLAGIKIYNVITLDTEFLPASYPNVLEFIIMGVDHSLQDNDWITNLSALSIPLRDTEEQKSLQESFDGDIVEKENIKATDPSSEFEVAEADPDLVFGYPAGNFTGNIRNPLNFPERDDSEGGGWFTARRTHGPHKGIDIRTATPPVGTINATIDLFKEYPLLKGRAKLARYIGPQTGTVQNTLNLPSGLQLLSGKGTPVFAPMDGIIFFNTASEDSILPGFKIKGTGEFKGYTIDIFYAAPDKSVLRRGTVKKGDLIGYAIQVDLQPKYKGVSNHIHFQVKKGSSLIDPTKLTYQ